MEKKKDEKNKKSRKKKAEKLGKEKKLDFIKIEQKWQKEWEKKEIFKVKKSKKKKFYVLEMFPYSSGSGLHMGHALNYTIGDIYARFKRMMGFNVLYPMGFDALGLPAENAAIKAGEHPKKYTKNSIKNFIKQMKEIGLSYDWSRMISTMEPEYYKWDQWIFLKMHEKGLAYRKKAAVNYCEKCNTVLANEQVHNGKCWRHEDTEVEMRHLKQWFFKITDYADELLEDVDKLQWPERIKIMQKNWIGKSHGTEIKFEINGEYWKIFTTRPDTIFGVTFMVISAQHPDLMDLVSKGQKEKVEKFLKKIKSTSEKEMDELDKEGVFTGLYAVNPVNNEKVPVYVGNFVVAEYGSGMVMAVPAHDQRDFEFAKKYDLPIKVVIQGNYELNPEKMSRAYTESGRLINSDKFNGWDNREVMDEITKWLKKKGKGEKSVQYKLRDWLISRQRYWGTPIPIIYCDKCGVVPVPEKDLPVKLPEKVDFGKGNPLESVEKWKKVKCPKCGKQGKRETDTMDTFVNSSWYYLRYADPNNNKKIFDKKKASYWTPVDQYIGGAEHACMHLIYARFYNKFLRDLGLIEDDEPFIKLFNQGMLHGPDGHVMSKSRGNVVLPEKVSKKYGMDTARLFLVSVASPDKDIQWSDKGIQGSLRFVKKIWEFVSEFKAKKTDELVASKLNSGIEEIEEDIENFRYNLAVIKVREIFDYFDKGVSKKDLEKFLLILSIFAPHICEELWHKLGNKSLIAEQKWPLVDKKKINKELEKKEEQAEKLFDDIANILDILEQKGEKKNKKSIKVYAIPIEVGIYEDKKVKLETTFGLDVEILSIKDAKKFGKQIKAKPGKPGILIE